MVFRAELDRYLAELLSVNALRDYCPNGLQVEGRDEIRRLAGAVTASLAVLENAARRGVDALLVHHGLFWRGDEPRVVGPLRRRIKVLLDSDMSLFAYHLPLDKHVDLGNNAQLGKMLGLSAEATFGEQDLGLVGSAPGITDAAQLVARIEQRLGRTPLLIGELSHAVRRVAWCTGAAQGFLAAAAAAGADAYISGEVSEQTVHLARETGVAYLAAGHHCTERFGVQAVVRHLAQRFGVEAEFIDEHNPV
jgi:dinuclear metal center YbgI/SA1388 family protein